MIPVPSQRLSERQRVKIVDEAREFHTKGLFIQECTNPRFLKALSLDFYEDLEPLQIQRYVAAQLTQHAIRDYLARLKEALNTDPEATLKRTGSFVKISSEKYRSAAKQNEYVVTLPDSYPTDVIAELTGWLAPFFGKPLRQRKANFWTMYTKWIWINQMTNAMCDLEGQIGADRLERMEPGQLFTEVLRVYGEDATAGPELARLTDWYICKFAEILLEALRNLTIVQLELILLLRRDQRERLVVLGDLGTRVDRLIRQPQEIYSIPSRQFEEVMAFALAETGYDDVRLTPPTRDGGYDIEAIRNGPICHRLLVECKRYARDRKVGRPTLDGLLGVLEREKANQAVLATTSSFSKDAIELFKSEPWRLQGMDIENVLKLLRQARRN